MKNIVSVLSLVLLVFGMRMSASEEVLITFPHSLVGTSRHGNLLVVVNYQRNDANKFLELVWDSEEGECGSSAVEITAENNGIPLAVDLVLSAGEYTFEATLHKSNGTKMIATPQVRFVTR